MQPLEPNTFSDGRMHTARIRELLSPLSAVLAEHKATNAEVASVCAIFVASAIVSHKYTDVQARQMCKAVYNYLLRQVEERSNAH